MRDTLRALEIRLASMKELMDEYGTREITSVSDFGEGMDHGMRIIATWAGEGIAEMLVIVEKAKKATV